MEGESTRQRQRRSCTFISGYLTQKLFTFNFQAAVKISYLIQSSKQLDPTYQKFFGKKTTIGMLKAEKKNNLMPHS